MDLYDHDHSDLLFETVASASVMPGMRSGFEYKVGVLMARGEMAPRDLGGSGAC
jgi:hypothetical protein